MIQLVNKVKKVATSINEALAGTVIAKNDTSIIVCLETAELKEVKVIKSSLSSFEQGDKVIFDEKGNLTSQLRMEAKPSTKTRKPLKTGSYSVANR